MWSMLGSPSLVVSDLLAFALLIVVVAGLAWDRPAFARLWPELASAVVCLILVAVAVAGGSELARLSLVGAGLGVLAMARMHRQSAFSLLSVGVPVALVALGALSVPACAWVMIAYCAMRVILRAGKPLEMTHA